MINSNDKETINLLELLSESDSMSDLIVPVKKKRLKRRQRAGNLNRSKSINTCGCKKSYVRTIALWLAAVLATLWLVFLSWLAIVIYGEIHRMDMSIKSVIAGSEGVPDALQKCHSLSKDLKSNQTVIFTQLSNFKLQITNFTAQLAGIQHELTQVKAWFQAAPELATVPQDLKLLSNSVAKFGSQIQDLVATVETLKKTNANIQNLENILKQNITSIQQSVIELSNVTEKPQLLTTNENKIKTDELNAAILHLTDNLTHINIDLAQKIEWIIEDQKKDHISLVKLTETMENVSSKVISLQRECGSRFAEQTNLTASIQNLTDEVNFMQKSELDLKTKLNYIEQLYNGFKNSTNNSPLTMVSKVKADQYLQSSINKAEDTLNDLATTNLPMQRDLSGADGVVRINDSSGKSLLSNITIM
ncbi:rho-associated protein kinase 1-like isoform X2 [Prorops nasuta]|uniref:rho-associated protein kinase 1-like isoform X2 n=2 Tax=Prorops nasuta TaxID=863751 RepID=UPI0034CECD7A